VALQRLSAAAGRPGVRPLWTDGAAHRRRSARAEAGPATERAVPAVRRCLGATHESVAAQRKHGTVTGRAATPEEVDLIAALVKLRATISAVSVDVMCGVQMCDTKWHQLADLLNTGARLCRQ